jgi:hypothetical protein
VTWDADYIALAAVLGVAVIGAWAVRRQSANLARQAVAVGLGFVAVAILLGILAGVDLVSLVTMSRSAWPGAVGYAASRTLLLGYGVLGAAAIHTVQKIIFEGSRAGK